MNSHIEEPASNDLTDDPEVILADLIRANPAVIGDSIGTVLLNAIADGDPSQLHPARRLLLSLSSRAKTEDLPPLWLALGWVSRAIGQPLDAIHWDTKVVETRTTPFLGEALNNIGRSYRDLKDWEKGLHYSLEASEVEGDHLGDAYLGVAISLTNMSRLAEAEHYFKLAVDYTTRGPEALLSYATNCIRLGEFERALSLLEDIQLREADQRSRPAWDIALAFGRALCYLGLGRHGQFEAALRGIVSTLAGLDQDSDTRRYFDHTWRESYEVLEPFASSPIYPLLRRIEDATEARIPGIKVHKLSQDIQRGISSLR